ncbi:MAG TPA: response regulator, partial [Flavisolibacter sp.]|nr:response regulator [Flavisolibacter sp.]
HHPDVVLCDMMMPETDGQTFLKLVRDDSTLKHIPVIFFSAGTLPSTEEKRLISAGNGFIKKPFLEEDLLSAIRTVIHKSAIRE